MTTIQLEMSVRQRFNTGLSQFIKRKVEVEGFYDYEVAGILNVDGGSIGKLRKTFGISRADRFAKRFAGTYGTGSLNTFKKLVENPDNTLADVARHFGFSREYARQVYRKVYGRPYTAAFHKKMVAREQKRLASKMGSKRIGPLMKVTQKMSSLGFCPTVVNNGPSLTIIANGYKVGFRSTSKPVYMGSRCYFRISQGVGCNGHYDFIICFCGNNRRGIHYIIPGQSMPKYGVYLLPEAGPRESKYAQYKEAWHLLTDESQKKEVS